MKEKMSWLRFPLEHYPITLLLVLILFLLGIFGMKQMPKNEFPPFTIRQGVVVAVYPGATSEEVEDQLARPLERYLFTYSEVNRKKTSTISKNGLCIVMLHLNDNVNNKDEVWSKIKHGLNTFKASLPKGVLAIVTKDDFGDTSALLIAVESPFRSYRELRGYTDRLSDRLRRIKSVSNVRMFGEHREQISLYVDRQRLKAYGVGQQAVFLKLQEQGFTTISGGIENASQQTPVYIEPVQSNEEEIANQIIFSDPVSNKVVRVRDIATVVREYPDDEPYIQQDGHPCVLLSLEMQKGENIVAYGKEVDRVLDDFRSDALPDDVTITRIADQPKVVGLSVTSFLRDLIISMIIIILVMMVLFPLRSAIVAAITIPLSTFISVAIMFAAGIELNIVTLAALIVVLGMVVDNSIVVIDGYLEYVGKGMKPKDAAIESARQYFMPMMLATVCICVIFFPLLMTMKGAFHDALEDFPMTITINLMVSLFLAVTVIPFLEVLIIKPEKMKKKRERRSITDIVQSVYEKVLKVTFKRPWVTIVTGFAVIALTGLLFPALKLRLFPYADRDQFAVEIFLPEGKGLNDTKAVADSMLHVLQSDSRVKCITSFVGCASPRFMVCYTPQMAGDNFAQFIVNTTSQQATLDMLAEYQPVWSEAFPEAYVRFKRLDFLEVTELEYRFYGEDSDSLHLAAERFMEKIRPMPQIEWVHSDYFQPYPLISVTLDPVMSAELGINKTSVALSINANSSNLPAGQVWEGDYEIPIVVKDSTDFTYSDIENIGVATPTSLLSSGMISGLSPNSKAVPLRQFATVKPAWSESQIVHRGGERCITVTAQFAQGVYATAVEKELARIMENEIDIPGGVRTEVGGEIEYDDDALPQIIGGIAIAMVIIFFFLLFNFKKYGITILCLVALAFMIPGTMIGLVIMNRMIGLTSVMGLITLMGMIMRNEILIFEHANDLVKKWTDANPGSFADDSYRAAYNDVVRKSAYDAGARRMVPIFLTTATTAVGVVPMIIAASSFWMPVGVTIFAGGIGSLIMVVTLLPVIYWKVNTK